MSGRWPIGGIIACIVGAWVLAGAPWAWATLSGFADLGTLRPHDISNAFPLACIAFSIIAVARGGPSSRPRLEPSMLIAVPGLLGGVSVLVLAIPRFGFDALDNGVHIWAIAVCALVSVMFATGVRHPLRHAAWGLWLLAVPPVALLIADTWSSVVMRFAGTLDATHAPSWMTSDAVGLGCWLLATGVLVVTGGLDHGRRLTASIIALVFVLVTSWIQLAAWQLAGEHYAAQIGLARVVLVVAVVWIAHRQLRVRESGRSPEGWRSGLSRRPTYGSRYVRVASVTALLALVLTIALSWTPGARESARLARPDARPVAVFEDTVTDAAIRDAELPSSRSSTSAFQRPAPWSALLLPLGRDTPSCRARQTPWWLDVWDDPPIVVPFSVLDDGVPTSVRGDERIDDTALTWVIVLPVSGRHAAQTFEPIEQLLAHLSRISRIRHVPVGSSSATLLYMRHHGLPFALATTTQAMNLPDGRHGFRTIVVATVAQDGKRDVSIPGPTSGWQRAAYGFVNAFRQYHDRAAPDADYRTAADRTLDVLDRLIIAGRDDVDVGSSGSRECPWRVRPEPAPRVQVL